MRFLAQALIGVVALCAASQAHAFDCAKAATASEKAICADPAANAADEAMSAAFATLMAEDNPSAKPAVLAAQMQWLRDRDNACADMKEAKLGACLGEQSARRRAFLAAEPEVGPGAPGRLAPEFRMEKAGKAKAGVSLQLLKYPSPATPAERAFNAAVDKLVGSLDEPEKDDPRADSYQYDRAMRLIYASPQLISAHLDGYSDTGGAHPNTFSGNVNIDIARGRELLFADLVDDKGAKTVFANCLKEVIAAKKTRLGKDAPLGPGDVKQLAKDVAESTGQLQNWSFGADRATVGYDAYAVGAYYEGAYDCVIPYAMLKPLAKAGFPLP